MNTMEKLYKSVIENQFKAFDNMLEGITVYKLIFDDEGEAIDGIIEYMNPVTVGTMDINLEDATGKNAMDLFGSDFLKPYFEAINEFLVKGEFKPFEVYYLPTDKYFLVSGFNMPDDHFAILRTDITDRKKAEKALIKSEENYRSIIENLQDGFFRLDKEGKIIMASPSAARIYGFGSVPEIIGITAIPLYKNIEDRKYLMAELNKHGKLNDYEVKAVKRDGTSIWISLNAQFYYDDEGQIQGIDGFVRDITKRKQAEEQITNLLEETQQLNEELEVSNEELQSTTEELRVSNEELHANTEELQAANEELRHQGDELLKLTRLFERVNNVFVAFYESGLLGVIFWNMDGEIIDANDKFLDMVGYTREDLTAGQIDWANMTPPEYQHLDEASMGELKSTGVNKMPFEKEYIRKDGVHVPIIVAGAMLDDARFNGVAFVLDITERKMAEEVLQTTLQRFYTIISSMHAAVLLVTEDNRIEFVNQAFCDYFSLTESPEDLVGITDSEMLKKIKNVYQNPEESISHIREIVSRSKPVIGEEVSMQSGRTCLRDFVPLYVEEKPYGRLWLHYDITKRKQLEIKQHQLARQRQLALDAAKMGWWHYDPVTDISTYDEQYKRIFGVSGSQRPNEEILKRLHPDDLPNVWAKVEAALDPADPQPYYAEYRIFRDGSVRWIEAHGIATFEGEGDDRMATSLVGTVEDITERKEAGEKLKESEEKFFKIFHSSPVGTVLTDEEGKFIEANESYLGLTGYSKAELIGHSTAELNIMDAENRDSIINETYEKGKIQDLEVEIQTKSGGKCTVLTTLEPIIISGKSRNLGFVYDITKRKKAEERINKLLEESQQLNEELQVSNEELQDTTEELQLSNDELQDTSEELHVANEELRQQGDELVYSNHALRESEIRLNRSQEIAHLGSWELDLVNNELYWSDEVYRIFGLQPQEFGATYEAFLEAIHPDDREAVDDAYTGSLLEGRDNYEIEHRVVRKSTGEIRIVYEKCEHFRDGSGQIIRSVGMVHDITERKKAEQEREVTVELLRIVNESIGTTDLIQKATIFFQEESGCEAVGIRLQEGEDYPYFEARGFPKEFILLENQLCEYDDEGQLLRDITGNPIIQCMCGNVICGRFDPLKPFFTANGSFWTNNTTEMLASTSEEDRQAKTRNRCNGEGYESVALIPLHSGNENIGLLQLNDRKKNQFSPELIALWERLADYLAVALAKFQAEEALKEAHDNLEKKVEERTVEIEEAYQLVKENEFKLKDTVLELERSNEELQSFAYITSHDLQEPLRSVASYAQLIQRRYGGQLDSDADEFIDFMVSGATRMKSMIQGLLDYSRVNRAGIEFVKTDMNAKVEKAVSNLQYAIDESSAEITHDNLPNVIADPDQMVRVFQNLIGNAIKFKKADEPPRIHISANTDKEKYEWVFSVKDNGIGMEKQYTDKIFEVFKRLHTIDEYEGTGIGLAIVKRIIERHGGRVWVESELGVGSTFYFTIPIMSECS